MPRLPDATALGSRPIPQSNRRITSDRSGEIVGRAVEGFGATVAHIGGQRLEQENRFAYAQARSALLSADMDARKELENDPDWQTYEERYRKKLTDARSKVSGTLRGNAERTLFEADADLDIERGAEVVRNQARKREIDLGRAALTEELDGLRRSALETPFESGRATRIQLAQDMIHGAFESGYIDAEERARIREGFTADYGEGFLDTQPLDEQIRILSKPKGTPANFIQPDRRAVLLKAAQREKEAEERQREADQKAQLVEARQAMDDRLRNIDAGSQYGLPIDVPDKATLKLLYGEQEGEQRFKTAQKLAGFSAEVAELHALPANELIAQANKYQPTAIEGAALQDELRGRMSRSVGEILKAREDDPATYLIQTQPRVAQAWEGFTENPQAYLATVRVEKERLGIGGNAVIPEPYIEQVADEIGGAATAEALSARIEEEAARWGDAWPDVYGQLAGKLPDVALVIGSGIPKPAANALAATMGFKDVELKAMLPPSTTWTDLDRDVDDEFADFTRSLPPEAARTANAVKDAALRLSVSYMNQGQSRSNAVKKAYKDLVGSQYELAEFRGATMRVPAGRDVGAIEDAAKAAVEAYEPDHKSLVVPRGAALNDEEYAGQWQDYVRENGYWLTRPDAKGLRLYVDGAPVTTAQGPFELDWDELSGTAPIRDERRAAMQSQFGMRR